MSLNTGKHLAPPQPARRGRGGPPVAFEWQKRIATGAWQRPIFFSLSRQSRNQTGDRGRSSASAVPAILNDPPIHIRPDLPAARVQSKQTPSATGLGLHRRFGSSRLGPGSNHTSRPLRAPSGARSDRRGDRSPTARAICCPDWPTGHWSATRCFPLKPTLFGRPPTDNGRPTYRDGSGNAADRPKSLHIALHGAGTRRPFGEMPPMRP